MLLFYFHIVDLHAWQHWQCFVSLCFIDGEYRWTLPVISINRFILHCSIFKLNTILMEFSTRINYRRFTTFSRGNSSSQFISHLKHLRKIRRWVSIHRFPFNRFWILLNWLEKFTQRKHENQPNWNKATKAFEIRMGTDKGGQYLFKKHIPKLNSIRKYVPFITGIELLFWPQLPQ